MGVRAWTASCGGRWMYSSARDRRQCDGYPITAALRAAKRDYLRQLDYNARHCIDGLGARSWTNHYRKHNKTADRMAANSAMGSKRSVQTAAADKRVILDEIKQYLENDFQQWISTSLAVQQTVASSCDMVGETSTQRVLTVWATQH